MPAEWKVRAVLGTRPEAIKFAPLVDALDQIPSLRVEVLSTQQHFSLLESNLEAVGLRIDVELGSPDRRNLETLTCSVGAALASLQDACDLIVVQGDTLSAYAGALHGFLRQIPVAHLEAGLRTSTVHLPHPEEGLRRMISRIADLHLAPTAQARANLMSEGLPAETIAVIGNTSVDASLAQAAQVDLKCEDFTLPSSPYCVLTVHRRETWGEPMRAVALAIQQLAFAHPDMTFLCPLHPNPLVREPFLSLQETPNIQVVDPIPYDKFVGVLKGAVLILTDSGGIQEESTVLGVPVVILRDETERPEVVEVGLGFLAGTDAERIVDIGNQVLAARLAHAFAFPGASPFGDGNAGVRGARAIEAFLQGAQLPPDWVMERG